MLNIGGPKLNPGGLQPGQGEVQGAGAPNTLQGLFGLQGGASSAPPLQENPLLALLSQQSFCTSLRDRLAREGRGQPR